ncbi:unnamed protein product [Rotaria sp. Silwood1]|nr:unnamed protein product [Rotaria sp. Silwood1]
MLAVSIVICYLFYFCNCGTLPASQIAEKTLVTTLLNGYDKTIRPNDQVSVDITAALQQIVSIDEKQQIMTSSSFISQTWLDERLSWAPNASSNIEVLMLPAKSLWIPDTMILNSADTSGYLTVSEYNLASIDFRGQVYLILPALTIKTRCNFFVQQFPFDKQMCSINLTSWSQGSNRIIYTENASLVIDISGYSEHPLWKLKGTDLIVIHASDRVPFENTYNDVISIQLYLQRKPTFFILNGIFACLILNCVTLLSFTLPFGSQIGLCMTCFMTYSVYSLSFSNIFPQQSEYLMMITLFFLLSMCWTLISMTWFIICNHFITKAEMPKPLFLFCGLLQRAFFYFFPKPKKDDKKESKKDVIVENGEIKKTNDEKNTKATATHKIECVSCQKLFSSCLQRHAKVESVNEKQEILVQNVEPINTNPTDVEPIETAVLTNSSEIKAEICFTFFDQDQKARHFFL